MKRYAFIFAALAALAGPADAACYADYKAKKDNPLRLHYGVVELRGERCTRPAAKRQLTRRLARRGWVLLNVVSVFDESGLAKRKESAGANFLRF